jgi:hypothetical protein
MCAQDRSRLALLASLLALLLLAIGRAQAQDVPTAVDRLRQIELLLPTLRLSLQERGSDLAERERLSQESAEALKVTESRLTEIDTSLNVREREISERESLHFERLSELDEMERALQILSDSYWRLSKRYSLAKYGLIGLSAAVIVEGIILAVR